MRNLKRKTEKMSNITVVSRGTTGGGNGEIQAKKIQRNRYGS
jgi:hypothetical protein